MVKIDYFDIQLDSQNKLYYAGQKINGALVISLQDSLKTSGITVTLTGDSKTSWVNKTSDKIFESTETYVGEYVDIRYLDEISDGELMPIGKHTMPFSFQLPPNLPSTYEGDFGYIRYRITAVLRLSADNVCMIPSLQSLRELSSEKSLTVLGLVDVKDFGKMPEEGVRREECFEIVGCCCAHGTLEASVSLPTHGYLVGRTLTIDVSVNNRSGNKRTVELMLMQDAHFQSKSRYESVCDSKVLTRVVESSKLDSVENGKSMSKKVDFELPYDLTPTSILRSSLITVSYRLKLDFGNSCEIVVPIVVATVG